MESTVIVDNYHGTGVVEVSMNRPEQHNALNRELIEGLTETFQALANEKTARVVVLTGVGRSFCAGADLKGVKATSNAGITAASREGEALFDLMSAVNNCPAVVIGRVDGWAVGGGMGLVSCCDLVVATDRAKFGFSEVRLGLIPAVITPFVLSRIHVRDARRLYLTGERFDAHKAREIGLVDQIVDRADLDEQVEEWIQLLLKGAPEAQSAVKELLRGIAALQPAEIRNHTSRLFAERVISDEGREGVEAFIEKRRARWDESSQSG